MTYDHECSLLHTLHRAWQATGEYYARAAGLEGLTPRQLAVMSAIASIDGPSQIKIVEATGIDRSTMADVLKRLQRVGLVSRVRSRVDARRNVLKLTPLGDERLKASIPTARKVDEYLRSTLSLDEVAVLSSALRVLTELAVKPSDGRQGNFQG